MRFVIARLPAAAYLCGAAIALAACSTSGSGVPAAPAAAPSAPSASSAAASSSASTSSAPKVLATTARPRAAKTPVPAPKSGDIHHTVAAHPQQTLGPAAFSGTPHFGTGVLAALTSVRSVRTTASGPGQIAGPGVRLSLRLTNQSKTPVSLSAVVVNVMDARGDPAVYLDTQPGVTSLSGELAPGQSRSGDYVFTLPNASTNPISVEVSYSADAPVVVFKGNVK